MIVAVAARLDVAYDLDSMSPASFSGIPPDAWDRLGLARAVAAELATIIRPQLVKRMTIKPSTRQAAGHSGPWAEIPFEFSDGDDFNRHPHLTVALHENFARIQVTVPDKAGAYWAFMRKWDDARWVKLATEIDASLKRTRIDKVYREPTLTLHIHQRRFRRLNDPYPYRDGYLLVDLDTYLERRAGEYPAKNVPVWFDSFGEVVRNRRGRLANLELGFGARFPRHAEGVCHGPDLPDRMADAAVALEPFVAALRAS